MEVMVIIVLLLLFVAIPLFTLYCLAWALVSGLEAWALSRKFKGEQAHILRFLALNLCEPAITFTLFICLFAFGNLARDVTLWAVLVTLSMLALLVPGTVGFLHPLYRKVRLQLFGLGAVRWFPIFLTLQFQPYSILTSLLWVWALWYTAQWGTRQKQILARPPGSARAVNAPAPGMPVQPRVPTQSLNSRPGSGRTRTGTAPMRAARTASVPQAVPITTMASPQQAGGSNAPGSITAAPAASSNMIGGLLLPCPVCHAPTARYASECRDCGLVFVSRVPAALRELPAYEVLRPLGSGGMSSVYLARKRQSNGLCVIKSLASVDGIADPHWRSEAARCLRKEAELLQQLDHPNIVRVLNTVATRQGDFLVLEYVPGPTLEERLTRPDGRGGLLRGSAMPPQEALRYGVSIAGVLDYLARLPEPVVHHDIKPANLIVRPDDNRLILVDFGSAVLLPSSTPQTIRLDTYGTPGYAAPEQYQGTASPKSDVYALAATLYHLLTDDDPTGHPLAFPAMTQLPPDVAAVLQAALVRDAAARPDARTLRHWLQSIAYRWQTPGSIRSS